MPALTAKLAKDKGPSGPLDEPRDRSTFLFFTPDPNIPDHAQCSSCRNWGSENNRCFWLQKNDDVDGDDSCGMYGQGEPQKTVEPTGQYTKKDVGFVDEQVRCENCNAFDDRDKSRIHCDLFVQLNRMFPKLFKLKEEVTPRSCCNAMVPGKRDPRIFGPYGPMPDADDPNAKGGLIMEVKDRPRISGRPARKRV